LRDVSPALAQRLAAGLLDGRDDPGTAVEKIASASTGQWPWLAWAALGDYANEYGSPEVAADCFYARRTFLEARYRRGATGRSPGCCSRIATRRHLERRSPKRPPRLAGRCWQRSASPGWTTVTTQGRSQSP
jgi:hypothetical protein